MVIVLFISLGMVSYAKENETINKDDYVVRFSTIYKTSYSITKSGLTVTCNALLIANQSTNLKIVMTLQKSTSNGWTDVKTWTKTGTGTRLSMEETKVINIFSTYRLRVTFTAGNESYTTYAYY